MAAEPRPCAGVGAVAAALQTVAPLLRDAAPRLAATAGAAPGASLAASLVARAAARLTTTTSTGSAAARLTTTPTPIAASAAAQQRIAELEREREHLALENQLLALKAARAAGPDADAQPCVVFFLVAKREPPSICPI